jgi:hypothetical protein
MINRINTFIAVLFLGSTNLIATDLTRDDEDFKHSPKFLVHIGFQDGLPKDGIMKASEYDPCLYFSLNGPFPNTKLMAKLEYCPNIIILPLTEKLLKRCVSFHPTEILLIGELDLISYNATVVCHERSHIPSIFQNANIQSYKEHSQRDSTTRDFIAKHKGSPSNIHLENDSWNNSTKVTIKTKDGVLDINKESLYPNILSRKIPYTTPAGSQKLVDGKWTLTEIGILSAIKGLLYEEEKDTVAIEQKARTLKKWVSGLDHLEDGLKNQFCGQIDQMIAPSFLEELSGWATNEYTEFCTVLEEFFDEVYNRFTGFISSIFS